VKSNVEQFDKGAGVKHLVDHNSLKLYDHLNVPRPETTINNPRGFRVLRWVENDPDGAMDWRPLRRGQPTTRSSGDGVPQGRRACFGYAVAMAGSTKFRAATAIRSAANLGH